MITLKAPFPYFGGKSRVAKIIWDALGQPKHYIEPFFGSGAVLLAREIEDGKVYTETVNDKDGFLANAWRALQHNPDEVAKWCDWPVNHADLCARKKELLKNEEYLLRNLINDTVFYDAKMAGYWIWAASCWIGSGLTSQNQRPHIGTGGNGVHAIGQRPHICNGGNGVHSPHNVNIYDWFRKLSERLRYVRVVCGDWTRVCGGNWQDKMGIVGIFFDPPYGVKDRDKNIYHHDGLEIARDVEKWCLERGERKKYRIVVAGYENEYAALVNAGWKTHRWSAHGGYSAMGKKETRGKKNKHRETLFFSPHCLRSC